MGITARTRDKIKSMYNAGWTCVEISKKMGIAESIVRSIVFNH